MSKSYLKIGSYTPATDEAAEVIDREYYRQGYIVKDEEAFLFHPDTVCYVAELSDTCYTRRDFLSMCNDQEEFARECFYAVDWQHPETWVDEQELHDEWGWCSHCEKIYSMAGVADTPCPLCGRLPDEGGENADTESERRPAESGGI